MGVGVKMKDDPAKTRQSAENGHPPRMQRDFEISLNMRVTVHMHWKFVEAKTLIPRVRLCEAQAGADQGFLHCIFLQSCNKKYA